MEANFYINNDEEVIINVPYRRLVWSLMYISITSRPDISFSTSYLSRFSDKVTLNAWNAGKRILRYLSATKEYGLIYRKSESGLLSMSDADWGGDQHTRKSVSGFVCFYANNPIAWHSRRQNCVALSSMEAEYVSAGAAAQELANLKRIISEFKDFRSAILRTDNLSAKSCIKIYKNCKRSKHIDIKYHYMRDLWKNNIINVEYVSSSENIADMLTKHLGKEKFVNLRNFTVNFN